MDNKANAIFGNCIYYNCVGKTRFLELAREAGAAVKINGTVLVDSEKLDSYIETFRI